jgi:hypothetical protein
MRLSIAEIIDKACELKSREEKVEWLKANNSVALRNILISMYDKSKIEFLIPNTAPPYKPSEAHDIHGALLREARKLKYFIKGMGHDEMKQLVRERVFIELLETVDKRDAELLIKMIKQKPLKGLTVKTINDAFGPIISEVSKDVQES